VTEALAGNRHLRPGVSPLDSLMIAAVGQYYDTTGSIVANQHAAFRTAEAATQRYPNDALAWYLYADFRFHSDPNMSDQEALRLFNRSVDADSSFAPSYIHAIELSSRYGVAATERVSQAYLARSGGDREGDGLRLAADLAAPGGTANARVQTLIDTVAPVVLQTASNALARLPDSAEALVAMMRRAAKRPDAPRNLAFQSALANALAMRGHVAEAWRAAVPSKSYAAAELAILGLVPADTARAAVGSWMRDRSNASISGMIALAVAHDTAALETAMESLQQYASQAPANLPRMQRAGVEYFAKAVRAYYELARADTAAAAKAFDALSDSLINYPVDQFVRARLIARTDPKRAYRMMTGKKTSGGIISVARELEIGRLGEKLGDTPRAVDAYAYVAAAWQNSENEQLRNAVKESRDALRRLDSDGRVRAQLANPR
jgi:hypothetical protein